MLAGLPIAQQPIARSAVTTDTSSSPNAAPAGLERRRFDEPAGRDAGGAVHDGLLDLHCDEPDVVAARSARRRHVQRVAISAGAALASVCLLAVLVAVPAHERRIERRAVDVLQAAGYAGLLVHADGDTVRVRGARSERDADAIADLLGRVPAVGSVRVSLPADDAEVPTEDPEVPRVAATLHAGRLVLHGQVPGRMAKDVLLGAADAAFGAGQTTDELRAASAPPSIAASADVAVLAAMVRLLPDELVSGEVALDGRTLTVSGLARSSSDLGRLDGVLAAARARGMTVVRQLKDVR